MHIVAEILFVLSLFVILYRYMKPRKIEGCGHKHHDLYVAADIVCPGCAGSWR